MQLRSVILPVDDMDAAVAFWTQAGLTVKFRDGDRYAALDASGFTVALAAAAEAPPAVALSFKVDDVASAVSSLEASGASVVSAPEEGPHEIRATVRDPSGNVLVVYSARRNGG